MKPNVKCSSVKHGELLSTGFSNGQSVNSISIYPDFSWMFLDVLGFISFFGVVMVRAQSYKVELTMCIMTIFSISMFCYMLSDFDNVLHGVFRVDLSQIHSTLLSDLNGLCEKHCEISKTPKTLNDGTVKKTLPNYLQEIFSMTTKELTFASNY